MLHIESNYINIKEIAEAKGLKSEYLFFKVTNQQTQQSIVLSLNKPSPFWKPISLLFFLAIFPNTSNFSVSTFLYLGLI